MTMPLHGDEHASQATWMWAWSRRKRVGDGREGRFKVINTKEPPGNLNDNSCAGGESSSSTIFASMRLKYDLLYKVTKAFVLAAKSKDLCKCSSCFVSFLDDLGKHKAMIRAPLFIASRIAGFGSGSPVTKAMGKSLSLAGCAALAHDWCECKYWQTLRLCH